MISIPRELVPFGSFSSKKAGLKIARSAARSYSELPVKASRTLGFRRSLHSKSLKKWNCVRKSFSKQGGSVTPSSLDLL